MRLPVTATLIRAVGTRDPLPPRARMTDRTRTRRSVLAVTVRRFAFVRARTHPPVDERAQAARRATGQ